MTYLRYILEGQLIGIADGLYGNMKKMEEIRMTQGF